MFGSKAKLPVVMALSSALLVACGDGGSSSGGSSGSGTPVSGTAVKGPLVNATVRAYAVDYAAADLIGAAAPVDTGSTNSQAQIVGISLDPAGAPYIVVVEADGDTTDLTTGAPPVITTMKTVITADMLNASTPVVATPLTSLAVEVAASKSPSAGTLQQSLTEAQNTVKSTLGFGLDESVDLFSAMPVLTDDADTPEEQAQVAAYRLAVEAVSAVLANAAADSTDTGDSATDVLSALALDLSDGQINGMSGATPLPQLAGVDVSADAVASLTIPGTVPPIPVTSIIDVLNDEADDLNTGVTVNPAEVSVTPEEVATVADTDYDGVADDVDNCVNVKNGPNEDNQLDANSNGVGAACEAAPGISAVTASGSEDGGVINITLSGSDAQGDTLTFTVDGVTLPAGQTSYVYSPNEDFFGQVVLPYSVSDGESSSANSTITIDISATDDAPTGSLTIVGAAEEGVTLSLDNQLADVDGSLTVVSYQWTADDVDIVGATNPTLTLTQAHVGAQIRADIVVSDGVFANVPVSSNLTGAVANTIDNPTTGSIALEGLPFEGETLTFSSTLADPDGPVVAVSYQWLADGANIDGATSASLLLEQAQVGKAVSLELTYTDGTFINMAVTPASPPVVNVNDDATGSVTISGTATEDQTLEAQVSASDEDGLSGVSYSYQWYGDDVALDGATTSMLTLDDSHVGQVIKVEVNFTDDLGGNESLVSDPTSAVANVNDPLQGSVVISGTAMDTQQLSVASFLTGLSDDDGLPVTPPAETTYQWKRDASDIGGATAATYTLVTADVGAVITVEISFPDNRGTTETILSQPTTAVVAFNNLPTGSVVISGDTQNQEWTVSDDLADADGPATLVVSYQWYADGGAILDATTNAFTPGQEYVGASIFVRASYTDDDGYYTEVDSASVVVIDADDAYTGGVAISGSAAEDQTLTATNDLADIDGDIVIESYQWQADGLDIVGATSDSLLLGQDQVGAVITVDVTFNDSVFGSQTATSSPTAAVANINDDPAGSLSISGTPAPGNDLTAIDAITDEDGMGMVSYEWFVDGLSTAVMGTVYTVQPEDDGLDVFVRASYQDLQGANETVDSAAVTVQSDVQDPAFNPASFSGQLVYPVFIEDGDDSVCYGTSTFARLDLGVGGDFAATMACDDSSFIGTWALAQNNEVLVLNSDAFDQTNFAVAYGDVVDNKQAYCWVDDEDVTDSATALDICRNGESSPFYSLIDNDFDQLGFDSFYFSLADVHADTFDAKRFSHTWLAGRTLFDVWYGSVDYDGDCNTDTDHDRGFTQLVFSADGMSVDISGVANDACIETGVPIELNAYGQLGGVDDGAGINYLGSTDLYREVVFRNEDGSPDNVDRFYHTQSDAQAAYDALPGADVPTATYDQAFVEAQMVKSPIYNVYETDGQWYVEKIEFFGGGLAELTERTAEDVRFSDDAASYVPQGTTYSVSADHFSLNAIDQGEIYWHISEDPNIGAAYMTAQGNGFEVCWWDGVGEPCLDSLEWLFFSEEAAQAYADAMAADSEPDNALVGSWLIEEGVNQRNILTFVDNSRYVVFHEHTNADQTAGSAEYGSYTWDGYNFSSTVIAESDGDGGLGNGSMTIEIFDDELYLDGSPAGVRIADSENAIVGSWLLGSGDDLNILTVLSTSEYAIAHTQNDGCYGEPCTPQALSGEFGFYTWNGFNFEVTSVTVDTNGDGGLYNNDDPTDQQNESLELEGTTLTFTDADEGAFVLERIGALAMNLVCGYESGWDDMLEQPLVFNSIDDYNTVVSDCDLANGPLPSWSKSDLAGATLYDGDGEVTFDVTADTAVFIDYGDDETKGTGDDETFYAVVTDYDTDQVMLAYSFTEGGPIEGYDILTLLSYDGMNEYQFAVFYEEFGWAESDGNTLDTSNRDGEIWYWTWYETDPNAVTLACDYESGWDDDNEVPLVFNSGEDYYQVRSSCEGDFGVYPFSTASLVGQTFYEEWNETRFVFDANGTSATVTDAGEDGVLDTGDDETFYVAASDFDTNVVQFEMSLTPGGAVIVSELWSLKHYTADLLSDGKDFWAFAVFFEDYSWPESDGSINVDSNEDGEIWHNAVSTAEDFNWAGLAP